VFEVGLGFPQPGLQFGDLCAEVVGQGPGGVLLDAERVEEELDVHAFTGFGSRQVGVFAPVSRRTMTWGIAHRTREAEEAGRCSSRGPGGRAVGLRAG
jgi:hypothetical protein